MRPNNTTLQPVLSQKFEDLIWKIKVHPGGTVAIETRNSDLKQVAFSAADFKSGKVYFRERTYEEPWNLNLAYAGPENLLISGYEHSDTPESKGLISIHTGTGEIRWQKFNISLNEVYDEGIQVYDTRLQPRNYFWIDHLSGDALSAPAAASATNSAILFPETGSSFLFPSFLEVSNVTGDISALSCHGKQFLSFHEVQNNYLQQRLVVYQGDKILLDDIITSGIQKLQPEAFFIQLNHLFYIRNKREIVTYLV